MHIALLGLFYWMLLNIHPAHRSTLHTIQLLAVAKSTDIRVHGIDTVLAPAVADLEMLAKDVSNPNTLNTTLYVLHYPGAVHYRLMMCS